ncbi:virulence RhuM family protein [Flavobacterium acetivorans]|uniref:virulence RhuM family protein n=1 Tax=Flavobacterium acetivorans TaxID=2893883 RepID=UPI001E329290|nr:virulence RhuM family protein [Flavobacterium sp. F-29]UFH34536.1 virulence RhuM family protein [Flavobacterium sp. F-29]
MSDLMPNNNNFILYTAPNGNVKIEAYLQDETIWLTQQKMADVFGVTKSTISEHLSNIYESSELEKEATVRKFRTVQIEGEREVTRNLEYYNLDAIISVGYRVNSSKATQFRIWATKVLKEYIIKGFAMDDDRLKQGTTAFSKDYFKELLERVRSIRASERRIYQQVTDIFAECSIDYDPKDEITKSFYAMVQNKFHFAITGKTAAEIIYLKADSSKPQMGLTTFKNAPEGRILKSDTAIAKNYLEEKEIKQLERTVSGYFDYIENLIERQNSFTMEGLAESVNKFLNFNEYKVLEGFGKISHQQAINKAAKEYDTFNKTQKINSDFDKQIQALNLKNKKK